MGRPKKIEKTREVTKINLSNYVPIVPNLSKNGNVIYFNRDNDQRDNSYLEYLLDISKNTSSTHSNLLALKKDLTYGTGFDCEDEAVKQFLEHINPNQDGNDLLELISEDFSIFEASALQIVWSKDGKFPIHIYHIDIHRLRAEQKDEFGHVPGYWVRDNWVQNKRQFDQAILRNLYRSNDQEIFIPIFNPKAALEVYTEGDPAVRKNPELLNTHKEPVQILYIKKPNTGQPYYAVPTYAAAINYIELEKNLGVFHNASVANGFFPSLIINPVGSPTPEEKEKYLNGLVNSFAGAENASKAFIEFIEKSEDKTTVTPISVTNNAELYDSLAELALLKIASAHRAAPELAGAITTSASLGGDSNKLSVAYQLFYNNVIKGYQQTILKAFNKVLKAAGLGEVTIVNKHPLFLLDPQIIMANMDREEIRSEYIGIKSKNAVEGQPSASGQAGNGTGSTQAQPEFNAALAGLTGRQYQNLMRIIRQIGSGKLTKEAGIALLKASYGFTDELISSLLIDDEIEDIKQEVKPVAK